MFHIFTLRQNKKNVTENALPQWSINLLKSKICDNSSSEFKKSVYDLT